MNINDIVALARAGFTAQQITTMMAAPQGVDHTSGEAAVHTDLSFNLSAVPAAAPAAGPAPSVQNPSQAPAAPAAPAPAAPAAGQAPEMAELLAAVRSLEQTVRTVNIQASSQPTPQSCDEILASIINP